MSYLNDVDIAYIEGYMRNIRQNYMFSEVECELRAGQTSKQFEGNINRITLSKFRKIQDFYDNYKAPPGVEVRKTYDYTPSLDISFKKHPNLNPGTENLRFSLIGRPAISEYCTKNVLPSTARDQSSKLKIIYKDPLKWNLPESDEVNRTMASDKYTTYNNVANIELPSIRTRISGKVELGYDFKTGAFAPSDITNKLLSELTTTANKSLINFYDRRKKDGHQSALKYYRFKQRKTYTIIYKEAEFTIDLTKVKSSKLGYNNKPEAVKLFMNSDIADQPESYEYEIEFNLKDADTSVLRDFINDIYIPSFVHTNIHPSYTVVQLQKKVLAAYKSTISSMLTARIASKLATIADVRKYQSNKSDSAESEKYIKKYPNVYDYFNIIKDKSSSDINRLYTKLEMSQTKPGAYKPDNYYFISPKVVSMELHNIRDDTPINSIISDYTVTDKADGYSMIMVKFNEEGMGADPELINKIFMIDSNMRVYNTGFTTELKGTYVLNGEYLEHDNDKQRLNKYGVFDCYIYGDEDVCKLPLMSNESSEITRLSKATEFVTEINSILSNKPGPVVNTFAKMLDQYQFANKRALDPRDDTVAVPVADPAANPIAKPVYQGPPFGIFMKKFLMVRVDKSIFAQANTIWANKELINEAVGSLYYLDGLIFTHATYPVGYTPTNIDYDLKQSNTWASNLKWKPPKDNTIDCLIQFEQTDVIKSGLNIITKNKIKRVPRNIGGSMSYDTYIVANLYNGGNDSKDHPCFHKNNSSNSSNTLKPVLFTPGQPNTPNVHTILLPCTENTYTNKTIALDTEGEPIDNNTIIEVSYNNFNEESTEEFVANPSLRWTVLRTRHDKTFNYRQGIYTQKQIFRNIEKCLRLVRSEKPIKDYENALFRETIKVIKNSPGIKLHPKDTDVANFRNNLITIVKNFKSYKDIRTTINFGNHIDVAKNIWRTMHNPVTTNMITTGEGIPDVSKEEQKYYNRDVRRDKSISIMMQDFHNKIIKNRVLLTSVTDLLRKSGSDKISLLDLACGKGGDIPKWRDNNITTCVGIDYMSNNIDDIRDGACSRYNFYKAQANKRHKPMPDMYFLVGDAGKSINDGESITKPEYVSLANSLWKPHDEITTNFKSNKFNIVSVMFAMHYFFKSETILDTFIQNVADNIKNGGYFIGCCFDGRKIFEKLKHLPKSGSIDKYKNGRLMWKLIRDYRQTTFHNDATSIGMSIKVYISSINQIIEEFLVNFDVLKEKLAKHGIVPVTGKDLDDIKLPNAEGSFEDIYNSKTLTPNNSKILDTITLSPEEKELSFMFNYFIFKRKTTDHTIEAKIVGILLKSAKYRELLKSEEGATTIIGDPIFEEYDTTVLGNAISQAKINISSAKQPSTPSLATPSTTPSTPPADIGTPAQVTGADLSNPVTSDTKSDKVSASADGTQSKAVGVVVKKTGQKRPMKRTGKKRQEKNALDKFLAKKDAYISILQSNKGKAQNEAFIAKYTTRLNETLAKYPATSEQQIYINEIAREIEKSRKRLI